METSVSLRMNGMIAVGRELPLLIISTMAVLSVFPGPFVPPKDGRYDYGVYFEEC